MFRSKSFRRFTLVAALLAGAAKAHAQQAATSNAGAGEPDEDEAFELGQIIVTGRRPEGIEVVGATLNAEAVYTFMPP